MSLETCNRCFGIGSISSLALNIAVNGSPVGPMTEVCPKCHGRGQVEQK